MRRRFTPEQDQFLRDNIVDAYDYRELTDMFNARFPEHETNFRNLQKRAQALNLKKGSHNIRPGVMPSVNPIGTIIVDKKGNHSARIKTECGYVSVAKHLREKWGLADNEVIIHLNGDKNDWNIENLQVVTREIYASLNFRKWFFLDKELTKTAILTCELLMFFPDIRHNESQWYKMKRM